MTDRWRRIGTLFDRALAVPPATREAVIAAADEPADVKDEVRTLLVAHEGAEGFLEHGALDAVPAADASYAPGHMLGQYRIVRLIARGGMGVVYEAEDTRLGRRVALKALPAEVSTDARLRQRLGQEARAAAALQHPGIAVVYALEEFDGHLFISAEYLEGRTLREELRAGEHSPARALAAAIELSAALCAAHERGIVHRDLKPENVVRTADGRLKIVDFGLARFERPAGDDQSRSRLSIAGAVVGTPAYMAPEQLLARPADFRVDQFALGIMLYELGTGRHPFASPSLPSTIARILADAPDSPPLSTPMPPALWTVIDRCLQKDPSGRFASTRELLTALTPGTPEPHHAAIRAPRPAGISPSLAWWRFHQFAAALAYWLMVWPVWHVHRGLGRAGLFFFFATLATVVVAANLRLHLWFSSRVYPDDLLAQRADAGRWIRGADVAFVTLLIVGGVALPDDRAGWAALLISFGVGAAVAFVFIEPATARAAFRGRDSARE